MDPLRALIEYLQENLNGKLPNEALAGIEGRAKDLFAKFELVPKHEYQAQLDILASLEAQVASLEKRLDQLEDV
jgi:BMFP domain-containing protein YqiC